MQSPEQEARNERRRQRSERTAAVGPTPRNTGKKKGKTDADKVKLAHAKRMRRAERNLEQMARAREGREMS